MKQKIPIGIAMALLASQLAGCAAFSSNEMLSMLNSGELITIELAQPSYEIKVLGKQEQAVDWTQLDQMKTYNDLRLDFDTLMNINKITVAGVNSKSGCLYVDKAGNQIGNSTMENAFRNKAFINKYWNNNKDKIGGLATSAYTDEQGTTKSSVYATLNAYYDLLSDNVDPTSFNANQSVTREQFYSLVFRSNNGVKDLTDSDDYNNATGGKTLHSLYAQQAEEYAFLNTKDNCLDQNNVTGSISRAEAVYMVVNEFFGDQLANADGKGQAYSDCKNAGDLALKLGFKEKKDGTIIQKDNWQSYILAYMMQNPNKGMQEELYKAMSVAYENSLLDPTTASRWDEPISKAESIELLVNVFTVLNKVEGYLSEVEYGGYDEATQSDEREVNKDDNIVLSDGSTVLSSGVTLEAAAAYINSLKEGDPELFTDEVLEEFANNFGTTMVQVKSYWATQGTQPASPPSQPSQQQPTQQTPPKTNGSTSTPAPSKPSGNNNSSNYVPPEADLNHNGINDAVEGGEIWTYEDLIGGTFIPSDKGNGIS